MAPHGTGGNTDLWHVPSEMSMTELREHFGEIDIYLFDLFLRGRVPPGLRILDAGFGSGRNLIYFLSRVVRGVRRG